MQRYFALEKNEKKFTLRESDLYHIRTVMRKKNNDKIEVVYEKELYISEIIDGEIIELEKTNSKSNVKLYVNLIIPILKEQKLDFIIQKATELGVSKITLIEMERTVIKIEEKKQEKKLERWISIAREAAEQSKRIDIPEMIFEKKLSEIDGIKLVCSPKAKVNIKNHLKTMNVYDKLNIVIGPEGGLSEKEEKKYIEMGFHLISLGSLIMRAETVPLYLMSIINYEYME